MTMIFFYVFLLFFLHYSYCDRKDYSNYTLYRGRPMNEDHLSFLNNLTKTHKVNYWNPPGSLNRPVEFMIGPDMKKSFLRIASEKQLVVTTVIENLQTAFDKQTVKKYTRRKMETFDWKSYFQLKDIYGWLRDLVKSYPKSMSLIKIGKTYEHREILAVKISHPGSKKRSTVVVEGGIHAREWIAPAVVTYFLYKILTGPEANDTQWNKISRKYEFLFVPVLNPDGYVYTHLYDRVWRKNRAGGYGVDINRNFGIAFGTVGISFDKSEETYCGGKPFSEEESYAMARFIEARRNSIEYYLAFHSYGQYIILPYAYSSKHHDNYDEMKRICDTAAEKIKRRYKTVYKVGTAYDTLDYITSGVSGCWAKKSFGIPYVATFELPDQARYGFALPPQRILKVCEETMDGLLYILEPKTKLFGSLRSASPLTSISTIKFIDVWVLNLLELITFSIVRFS